MMIKYRVREVAKDLNMPNKDVLDILSQYFPEPKKTMTALEEPELDVIFETFTQRNSVKSLDEYFAQREEKKPEQPAPPAGGGPKAGEGPKDPGPKAPGPAPGPGGGPCPQGA